ncbi:hypothetical protein BJ971_006332 [Actinoplanes digitatis]|uniref:Uncharacterized protein n=1 Tax=Actinoplanes digitatis TaxID=1868 RepID=A0A7W7I3M2_9ACTN|nr:hypothetical protein [Actinoplanes digitatis]
MALTPMGVGWRRHGSGTDPARYGELVRFGKVLRWP